MAEDTKNEADSSEPTALEKKIIRQIEYYFGNSNMRRDRFLQLQVREDDGWVPMETMLKFNRLAQLSKDPEVIVTALSKSTTGLMEVSEDKTKIRRSPDRPLPEENAANMLEMKARTVYCKGFPLDEKIDTIIEFMDKYGETENIFLRRDAERAFKGSVFATYKNKEDAKKFMEAESVKYGETEMTRYYKSDYYKMKAEERKALKEQNKKEKKEKKEQKDQETIEANTEYKEYKKGLVMHFSGASDQTSREDLKEVFGDYGTISWVDFTIGKTEGTIRFEEGTLAKDVIDKVLGDHNDKIEIRGSELTLRALEGEEEEQHWKTVFESIAKGRFMKQQGKRRKRDNRGDKRQQGKRNRYEGKKTKFNDDEGGEDEEPSQGDGEMEAKEGAEPEVKEEPASKEAVESKQEGDVKETPKEQEQGEKRPHEETTAEDEPSAKQVKTE